MNAATTHYSDAASHSKAVRSFQAPGVIVMALAVAVAVVNSNTLRSPFLFDDIPELQHNLDARSFSACRNTIGVSQNTGLSGRPFACLTFAANMVAHGEDVRGFHAANILIHLLASIILFLILKRTIERTAPIGSYLPATGIAGTIALLWAVHPLQTESVTYIIQRIESLAGLLFLLTLFCSVVFMEKSDGWLWAGLALVCCILGMLTKEIVAVAPLVVFLYDAVFISRSWTVPIQRRPIFYCALAATWLIPIVLISQSPRSGTVGFGLGVSALDYLRTQSHVLLHYVRLTLFPYPQSISYSDWPIIRTWFPALVPGLVILTLLVLSVVGTIRRRWWGFCGLWCFLILAPSSSFVPIVTEPAAERRMYLPLAGILTILVLLTHGVARRFVSPGRHRTMILAVVFGAVVLAWSARTVARNNLYRDPIEILSNDLRVRPGDELLRGALVEELVRAGRLGDAREIHDAGIAGNPHSFILYDNWARILSTTGLAAEAIEAFTKAIEIRPAHHPAWSGLGLAYIQTGRYADAVAALHRAKELAPKSHSIRANLAIALANSDRLDEAIHELRTAVTLKPNFADGHYNLARLLASRGDNADAIEHLRVAAKLNPGDMEIRRTLDELLRQPPPANSAPTP